MRRICLIVCDVRSALNTGSLLRTADGLGVEKVYLCGITPYLPVKGDRRLPHVARRAAAQISKTALGAEISVNWDYIKDIKRAVDLVQQAGFTILALEQSPKSIDLASYHPPAAVALIVGNEVDGLPDEILALSDVRAEIPMLGQKESFNVASAAAMGMYHLRFGS